MTAPTQDELERYVSLNTERRELERKAATLKKDEDALADRFREWLKVKDTRACKRLGYTLALIDGRKYPKWKDEFIASLGTDAAIAVEARTLPSLTLQVLPAA